MEIKCKNGNEIVRFLSQIMFVFLRKIVKTSQKTRLTNIHLFLLVKVGIANKLVFSQALKTY